MTIPNPIAWPRICLCGLFVFGLFPWLLVADDDQPITKSDLVSTQVGELPIILSAPHGGKLEVAGVGERTGTMTLPKGAGTFVTVRDTGTEELAIKLAECIEKKTAKKPYFVIARFSRKYIDANRVAEIAYENPKAKSHYDAYHQALQQYCRDVKKKFDRGLLLDIHGQGVAADTIFRGTQDGKTVELLRNRFGLTAVSGPESFCGMLAAKGMKVVPTDEAKEHGSFNGGYIVQTYGSQSGYAIDAIQLEFGGEFRGVEKKVNRTAESVAEVAAHFANKYLYK